MTICIYKLIKSDKQKQQHCDFIIDPICTSFINHSTSSVTRLNILVVATATNTQIFGHLKKLKNNHHTREPNWLQ